MSYVIASPQMLAAVATDVAGIGSSLNAATAAAAMPTTNVLAAAQDEVSAAITSLFSGVAQDYQALSARAAAFHSEFVQALGGAGGAYVAAEAASASGLQAVGSATLQVVNAPTEMLVGRPLIGDAPAATTPGAPGGAAGILFGNGGNGAAGVAGVNDGAGGA
ncbi:PE family protein, partial [Mycobacterium sp. E3198]|uniref:PE family protein n=1 Tax=Mycobacterium sp. E3198 TaxID=1834143 RepID=UPI000B02C538